MTFITYPYLLPDAVKSSLGQTYKAMQRSGQWLQALGSNRYEVSVYDRALKTLLNLEFREKSQIRGRKITHRRFSRRLRVRLRVSASYGRSVVTVSGNLAYSWSKTSITLGDPDPVLAMLSLRLGRALHARTKTFLRTWTYGTNLRPSPETSTGFVPRFRMDGDHYTNQGMVPYTNYSRVWSGVRTPGYRHLASVKRLPVNPHTVTMYHAFDGGSLNSQVRLDGSAFSVMTHGPYGEGFGTSDYGPTPTITPLSSQRNRAISRLRSGVIGETSNLSESIATFRKTKEMIDRSVGRIYNSMINLRRGNISSAAKWLFHGNPRYRAGQNPSKSKSLAENWLEMQYGWKPLLSDVEYAIQALGKLSLDDRTVGSSRASATATLNEGSLLRPNAGGGAPVVGAWYKTTRTTTRYTLRYRVASPARAFLAQSGFTNPVSLAWELLPFSFVADWFLPVGPYLESLDSWGGLELLDGSETTFTRVEMGFQRHYYGQRLPEGAYHPESEWSVAGSYFFYGISLSRSKLSSFPAPNFPQFKNGLSFTHTLNGIALLRSLFK